MQAQAQCREVVGLPAIGGAIFDRNLTQVVVNTSVSSAFISPDQVPTAWRDRVANALVSIVGADQAKVMSTLASGSKFAYISPRRFAKDKADKLTALRLPGVGLEPETQRSYLPGISAGTTLASNLLGFVNYNGDGQYGLQAYYQKTLAGRSPAGWTRGSCRQIGRAHV